MIKPLVMNPGISFVILGISVSLIISYQRFRHRNIFAIILSVLILADLFIFQSIGTGFRGNIIPLLEVSKQQDILEYLKMDKTIFRVYLFDEKIMQDSVLKSNSNMFYSINNVGIYTPLIFKQYKELLMDFGCVDDSMGLISPTEEALKKNLGLLSLLNVKYVLSYKQLSIPGLKEMKVFDKTRIYLNERYLPRAYIIRKKAVADGHISVGERDVIIDSSVKIEKYTDREVIISADIADSAVLVLSDYYYPGWQVFVDGKETEILQANLIMRGIQLSAGRHQVRFIYKRPLF